MAKQLQLRRGTTAQHSTFTGAVGEVTIDTDKDVVVVHDGSTVGGFPSQKELVSGTNIKTVNSTSLLGSGDVVVQESLVSGTNIKTINDTSLLGSGNIDVIQTISVTNIDELKDFVAPYNNYALNVLGYYEKGDGGGGLFYYDANSTEADNGGTIIEPTSGSGRWIRQYSGVVNVKWFGAKGDGVADDTVYIQSALNMGVTVYIPDGTYIVTDSLISKSNIIGDGTYAGGFRATIQMESTTAKNIIISNDDRLRSIEGICILGGALGSRLHTGIYGQGYRVIFKNIRFRELNVAMDFAGVYVFHEYLDIANCTIGYFVSQLERGLTNNNFSTMFHFSKCVLNYNGTAFKCINRYGMGEKEDLINLSFDECGFESNIYGIYATQRIWNLRISSSWFENNSTNGIYIPNTYTNITQINNRHETNSTVSVSSRKQINIDSNINTESAYINDISGTMYEKTNLDYLPLGNQGVSFSIPSTTREVYKFGTSGYASGTTDVNISLIPNYGNNNERVGGFINVYKVASTASTFTNMTLGILNKNSTNGYADMKEAITIQKDGEVNIGVTSKTAYPIGEVFAVNGNAIPFVTSSFNLGTATYKWNDIYAVNGTIITSDERLKTFINIEDAEIQCAKELKKIIKKYKFNDSISKKGIDKARLHFGIGAQTVVDTFKSFGLDATNYGILCFDEWAGKDEVLDDDGNIIQFAIESGNIYGIRYDELAMFILAGI